MYFPHKIVDLVNDIILMISLLSRANLSSAWFTFHTAIDHPAT